MRTAARLVRPRPLAPLQRIARAACLTSDRRTTATHLFIAILLVNDALPQRFTQNVLKMLDFNSVRTDRALNRNSDALTRRDVAARRSDAQLVRTSDELEREKIERLARFSIRQILNERHIGKL